MTDDRLSAPKADALPGCATPRPAKTRRFLANEPLAEDGVHGNSVQNAARTCDETPGIVPNRPWWIFPVYILLLATFASILAIAFLAMAAPMDILGGRG